MVFLWHWSLVADLSPERTQAISGGFWTMSAVIFQLQVQFLTRTVTPFSFVFPDQQETKPFGPVSVLIPLSFLLYPIILAWDPWMLSFQTVPTVL